MIQSLIVYTEKQHQDSLRAPIRVALTLTPVDSRTPTRGYDKVAFAVFCFDEDSDDVTPVAWDSDLCFSSYELYNIGKRKTIRLFGNSSGTLRPAMSTDMTRCDFRGARWSPHVPFNDIVAFRQLSITTKNTTGSKQQIALCSHVTHSYVDGQRTVLQPIAAYHSVNNNERIVSPSKLMLQIYVVDEDLSYGSILKPDDLKRPLFAEPLNCETLPPLSSWRLSQDQEGEIHLKNDDQPSLGSSFLSKPWEKPVADLKKQLSVLQDSLEDTRKRLTGMEDSVVRALGVFASGQEGIADIRRQLSAVETNAPSGAHQSRSPGTDRSTTNLEARADRMEKALDQTQGYLSSVQKFLQNTRQQVAGLDGKVPSISAKVDELAESLHDTRDNVQNSLANLYSRVAAVEEKAERFEEVQEFLDSADVKVPIRQGDIAASVALPLSPADDYPSSAELPKLPLFGQVEEHKGLGK